MRWQLAGAVALVAVLLAGLIPGPADAEVKSRLLPQHEDETGVLRLAQVVEVATRQQILGSGNEYMLLLMAGVPDAQLGDGRLAVARVYCCGGSAEESEAIWAFVPSDINVGVGDVVEVRMGRNPDDNDLGAVNTVAGMRQQGVMTADGSCQWLPNNPDLPMRTLYCHNIEIEGWIQQRGYLRDMWHRPATVAAAGNTSAQPEVAPTPGLSGTGTHAVQSALGTNVPVLILVSPSLQGPIRNAALASIPAFNITFEGEPAADNHLHVVSLHFESVVNQSRQHSNRAGASSMGLVGWMFGSIMPWPCPTTHTMTGVIADRAGTELGRYAVQKEQKRVGTMLVCGKVDEPSDTIVRELMADFLQKLKDEKILAETAPNDSVPAQPDKSSEIPTP